MNKFQDVFMLLLMNMRADLKRFGILPALLSIAAIAIGGTMVREGVSPE
jgi:hypothetical protein